MKPNIIHRKLLILFFLFLINISFLYSQKKYTGLEFGLGLAPNFNFHNSSFKSFESYPNCCSEFESGFGIAYSFKSFVRYYPNLKLLENQWGINIGLSYDKLDGTLTTEDFFANIIVGNELKKGISEHKLVTDLSMLSIEPEIFVSIIDKIPLDLALGFRLGLPLNTNFKYSETLISPEGASFENYSRTRNITEGKIPNLSPLNFALSLGANYKFIEFSDFKVFSNIRYFYGLSNIVKNLDWKVNQLQLGLSIVYKVRKAEPVPPKQSPMPDYPPPPIAAESDARLLVLSSGEKLEDGDTLKIDVWKDIEIQSFPLLPIIFFEKNSAIIPEIIIKPTHLSKQYSLNKEILRNTVEILKDYPETNITILASSSSNEQEGLAKMRFDAVANYIEQSGINKSRINFIEKVIESPKNQTKANEDENYFVRIQFNSNEIPNITERKEITKSIQEIELDIKTESENPQFLKEITGKICLNDNLLENFYSDSHKFKLTESNAQLLQNEGNFKLHINAIYSEISGNSKVSNLNFVLKPNYKFSNINENVREKGTATENYSEFILGYFNFNESDFSYIDERVKLIVLQNLNNGKRIEILPFTDNIGTPEYNRLLASKRSESALRLLRTDRNRVNVLITGEYPFSNDTPQQRIYNRSVFVRIYE
jgi:outer membrane protein OmpA-like peptidoglycan-associated protein